MAELLGTKRKRPFIDDAVPTIFCFSEPPRKRKISEKRTETARKTEMVRSLLYSNEVDELPEPNSSDFMNFSGSTNEPSSTIKTKEISIQTVCQQVKTKSRKTQCSEVIPCESCKKKITPIKITKRKPFGTHSKGCNTEISFSPKADISFNIIRETPMSSTPVKQKDDLDLSKIPMECSIEEENEEDDVNDPTFVLDTSESESESEQEDDCKEPEEKINFVTEPKFIVFWSCLSALFALCSTCFTKNLIEKVSIKGSLITVKTICVNHHVFIWNSQPKMKKCGVGNILISAAILYSGNTFRQISEMFSMINIAHIRRSRFFDIQKLYLFQTVNRIYKT